MRCLTLAQALGDTATEVTFLCRQLNGHLQEYICSQGYHCVMLPESITEQQDALYCQKILTKGVELLVVDHYSLGYCWETELQTRTKTLLAIDDLANRRHNCDLLLDQNFHPDIHDRYQGLVPQHCSQLLGPEFALLRNEFHHHLPQVCQRTKLERLLLSFGGSDEHNLTAKTLRELASSPLTFSIAVIIGQNNPHRAEIEQLCRDYKGQAILHVQTEQMAALMGKADLAIGGGGASHWERCILGLPALVVALADNQIETSLQLHKEKACDYLGSASQLIAGGIRTAVERLHQNPEQLAIMSRCARQIMEKHSGNSKIVEKLLLKLHERCIKEAPHANSIKT